MIDAHEWLRRKLRREQAGDELPYTFRMWLSNRLHLLAARIHEDFHTIAIVDPEGKRLCTVSCYWQWTAGDFEPGYDFICSCDHADLR